MFLIILLEIQQLLKESMRNRYLVSQNMEDQWIPTQHLEDLNVSVCIFVWFLCVCVSRCVSHCFYGYVCIPLSVWYPIIINYNYYYYHYFIADGVINNYDTATALLITFVVNNHVDDSDNEDAELWEKEFLRTLKDYKSDNLTISYSAEVFVYLSVYLFIWQNFS